MNNPKISIIVATDKNRGIGKDNELLWNIPEELKRFREITTGHPIIMGRKTYESIGRPLPNRTNIIITHSPSHKRSHLLWLEGCIVVDSIEKAIEEAAAYVIASDQHGNPVKPDSTQPVALNDDKKKVSKENSHEIFIIGGGQIYKQAMESGMVDKLYITQVSIDPSSQAPQDDGGKVSGDFQPTVFFPEYEQIFNKKTFEKEIKAEGTKDGIPQTFKVKFLELEK